MSVSGARVEIVETDHEAGGPVVPTNVRVNGVDVGLLAKAPKSSMDADEATTVTLVLLPSQLEIKGDGGVRKDPRPIGFSAE